MQKLLELSQREMNNSQKLMQQQANKQRKN